MSGKKNNYGFYGSGFSGYSHYKQSFDRNRNISSAPTRSAFDNNDNGKKTNKESKYQSSFLQEVICNIIIPIGGALVFIYALIKAISEVYF